MSNKYDELMDKMREIKRLENISCLVNWDMETYMPSNASEDKGYISSTLGKIIYDKLTNDDLYSIVKDLLNDKNLDDIQKKNITIIKDDIEKTRKIPSSLVQSLSLQKNNTKSARHKARDRKDFNIFAEEFKKLLDLNIKEAQYVGYKENIYDYFLDGFDPGTKTCEIDAIFKELKPKIIDLSSKILIQSDDIKRIKDIKLDGDKIKTLSEEILQDIGYDFSRGRLDISAHPFSSSLSANDVRITTRVENVDFVDALMSTIHEVGHALCELGKDKSQYGMPAGHVRSLALHESQSMIWEYYIAKNPKFWNRFFPLLKRYFPDQLNNVSEDSFIKLINNVERNLIRTNADQLNYNIHIIIRYEIEKDLLEGKISVDEMPYIWNKKYKDYLGLEPNNINEGVLQDIHWSLGAFGYFPVYSLGNMYAYWIYDNMDKQLNGIDYLIEKGDFETIIGWLNNNIHEKGSLYKSLDVINSLSDENFEIDKYIKFMEDKYRKLGILK